MLKNTAFIGYGFVGKSCHKAFEHNTEAIIIDPKYSTTTVADLAISQPKLTFVSVFAPTLADGSVDASIIYSIFQQLTDIQYKGLVVLKSTLPPSIVDDLYVKFGNDPIMNKPGPLRYIYSPEFIREATWEKDAVSQSFIILAGYFHDCEELKTLYRNHSSVAPYCRFFLVDYKEASLAKYTINSFLSTKLTFMNQIYQVYLDMYNTTTTQPESWKAFTEMLSADLRIGSSHMQVPGSDGQFGYGGSCFPKDVKAFLGADTKNRLSVLTEVELANTRIRLTGDGQTK